MRRLVPHLRTTALLTLAALLAVAVAPAPTWAHADRPAEPDAAPSDPPDDPDCNGEGDPVTPYSGVWKHEQTDLVVNGIFPIEFKRQYDSQSLYDSPLGYGWSFSYDMRLFTYPDGLIVVRRHCGTRLEFTPTGGSSFDSPPETGAKLKDNGNGTHTLKYPKGTKYQFDVEGRLEAIQDPSGNRLEFTYDPAGLLPLTGTSPSSIDPATPMVVAHNYHLTRIEERVNDGTLTGRAVDLAYDGTTGRLTSITSYDGRSVSYFHDEDGPGGLTTGNLVLVEGLEAVDTSYEYEDPNHPHNVTSFVYGGVRPIMNTYDAEDRVILQELGDTDLAFAYTVTPAPRTVVTRTVRDAAGSDLHVRTTTYDYEEFDGYVTKITDSLGHEFVHTRFVTSRLLKKFEVWENQGTVAAPDLQLLKTVKMTYNGARQMTSRSVELDSGEVVTESWEYDDGRVSEHKRQSTLAGLPTVTRTYTYVQATGTSVGRVGSVTVGAGTSDARTRNYTYVNDKPASVTFSDQHKVVRRYYSNTDPVIGRRGMLRKIFHEIGASEDQHEKVEYDYDVRGNLILTRDGEGNETHRAYDDRGRLTQATNALNEVSSLTFRAPNGTDPGLLPYELEVGRVGAEEGQITQFLSDPLGRLASYQRKDDSGQFLTLATFVRDSDGRVLTATDADLRTVTYTYDVLGRRKTIKDAENRQLLYAYDGASRRVSITDSLTPPRTFTYTYDDLDRIIKTEITDGEDTTTIGEYAYDAAHNTRQVIDGNSQVVHYDFNSIPELKAVRLTGESSSYQYDSRGRVDFLLNGRGQKIDYTYKDWGPVESIEFFPSATSPTATRTIGFGYDFAGNRISVSDSDLTIPGASPPYSYEYDALNRVDKVTIGYIPGGDREIDYEYDSRGNLESLTLKEDDGETLAHHYDRNALGRLQTARFPDGAGGERSLAYEYFDSGRVKKVTRPGGVVTDYTYEPAGAVNTIQINGPGGLQESYAYDYDEAGRILTFTENGEDHTYDYDLLSRVTLATHPTSTGLPEEEEFVYDDGGNREDPADLERFTYGINNRLTGVSSYTVGYDGDGNISAPTSGAVAAFSPTNRLTSYSTSGVSATYKHDASGRRVFKSLSTTQQTHYLWAGGVLLAEYDHFGNRTASYAYTGGFTPTQAILDDTPYDVHTNSIGAPTAITSPAGALAWQARYMAYGSAIVDDDVDGNGAIKFDFRLPGHQLDSETGFHHNGLRAYDPTTGRYLQEDPFGQSGGLNLYLYAGGNPINWIDPFGTVPGSPTPLFPNPNCILLEGCGGDRSRPPDCTFGPQDCDGPDPDEPTPGDDCDEEDDEPGDPDSPNGDPAWTPDPFSGRDDIINNAHREAAQKIIAASHESGQPRGSVPEFGVHGDQFGQTGDALPSPSGDPNAAVPPRTGDLTYTHGHPPEGHTATDIANGDFSGIRGGDAAWDPGRPWDVHQMSDFPGQSWGLVTPDGGLIRRDVQPDGTIGRRQRLEPPGTYVWP